MKNGPSVNNGLVTSVKSYMWQQWRFWLLGQSLIKMLLLSSECSGKATAGSEWLELFGCLAVSCSLQIKEVLSLALCDLSSIRCWLEHFGVVSIFWPQSQDWFWTKMARVCLDSINLIRAENRNVMQVRFSSRNGTGHFSASNVWWIRHELCQVHWVNIEER